MNGKGFHDVVKDCNNGCYKGRGFCATPGFGNEKQTNNKNLFLFFCFLKNIDLASGWGSPNYQALI